MRIYICIYILKTLFKDTEGTNKSGKRREKRINGYGMEILIFEPHDYLTYEK